MWKVPLFVFVVFLASVEVWGQERIELTVEQAVALAGERSISLGIASKRIELARIVQSQLTRQRDPAVSLKGALSWAPDYPAFGYDPIITSGGQISGQVVASHLLYDGGQLDRRIERGDINIEAATITQRLDQRDIQLAVRLAFYEVVRGDSEIVLATKSLAQLAEYQRLVALMYGGSRVGYTDLVRAKTRVSDTRVTIAEAQLLRDTAAMRLGLLLGLPEGSMIVAHNDSTTSLSGTTGFAIGSSPELALVDLNIRGEELDVRIARVSNSPLVTGFADAGLLTSVQNLQLMPSERSRSLGLSLGVSVEIPLLKHGVAELNAAEHLLAIDTLKLQAERLRRSIEGEYRLLLRQIELDTVRINETSASIAEVEKGYLLAKSRYAAGSGSAWDVLDLQQTLVTARLTIIRTEADIRALVARLAYLSSP
jgi:outer membrane protein TolC